MNPSFNITQGFTFASGQQNITGNITQLNRISGDNMAGDKVTDRSIKIINVFGQINDSETSEILQITNNLRRIISQLPQPNQEYILIDLEDVETEIQKSEIERNTSKLRKRLITIKTELANIKNVTPNYIIQYLINIDSAIKMVVEIARKLGIFDVLAE